MTHKLVTTHKLCLSSLNQLEKKHMTHYNYDYQCS